MSRPGGNPPPGQPPVSFKTVPGRNRTQKWTQAKTYNYDGDDWGGYDPYDEYGYEEPPVPQAQPARRTSFDRGVDAERRQFSGPAAYDVPAQQRGVSPGMMSSGSGSGSNVSGSGRVSGEEARRRMRDFSNPGQVPAPLSTRASPAAERLPPRKSSLSAGSPGPEASPSVARTDKPLPFIRPSDIYKRMNEEKERESARASQEGSRPSMDSVQREGGGALGIPAKRSQESLPSSSASGRRPSLEPVSEAREPIPQSQQAPSNLAPVSERPTSGERAFSGFKVDNPVLAEALGADVAKPENAAPLRASQNESRDERPTSSSLDTRPQLPQLSRLSGFGSLGMGLLSTGTEKDGERQADDEARQIIAPTHAPDGSDPAADILAERQGGTPHVNTVGRSTNEDPSGLASASRDPAADILAERQHGTTAPALGREAHEHPAGLSQQRADDPAADILADRQHDISASALGRSANEHAGGLSHQPSAGYRSVVNKAFDRQDDDSVPPTPTSHDNSQGVGRSDTNSTSSISPIMSRVPSAATAQQRQHERDIAVPPIAEEASPIGTAPGSRVVSDATITPGSVSRKPAPGHSRNVSAEIAGYRRSLDTPSPHNSPARTPGVEDTSSRRLSGPMAAQLATAETPDVPPEAPEMPSATLAPADVESRPMSTVDQTPAITPAAMAQVGRGRSNTDYSMREADLASEANTTSNSPENSMSPAIGEAATFNQTQYLRTHPSGPTSPASPSTGFARPGPGGHGFTRSPTGSGRNSPVPGAGLASGSGSARGRVKDIVHQYHQIDSDSRRNSAASGISSKSSWSQFGRSEENLSVIKRQKTGQSLLGGEGGDVVESPVVSPGEFPSVPSAAVTAASPTSLSRPEVARDQSFRPHLPGEWVSYAPTPAGEQPPSEAHNVESMTEQQAAREAPGSPPTPRVSHFSQQADEPIDLTPTTNKTALRGSDPAANAPGGAFASVKNAGDALGAALMTHAGYGHQTQDFAAPKDQPAAPVDVPELQPHRATGDMHSHNIPVLQREDSETTSLATAGSEVPPTPLPKDTPKDLPIPGANANADRPISGYFSGTSPTAVSAAPDLDHPAPLKFSRHEPTTSQDPTLATRPPYQGPQMSTDTAASDLESDRLRKDIVRSLNPEKREQMKRESIMEDVERTQDALDAPANQRKVESGGAAEGRSGLPSQGKPGLLDQRFSWENKEPSNSGLYPNMATVGEAEGDQDRRSYERPRSSQGLHVINTQVEAESEPNTAATLEPTESRLGGKEAEEAEKRMSAVLPDGTAALAGLTAGGVGASALQDVPPSPGRDEDEAAPAYSRDATPATEATHPTTSAPTTTSPTITAKKIPPFREILAIKSPPQRIDAYTTTRESFADMNTGLSSWLSQTLAQHPEHANLSTNQAPPLKTSGTIGGGRLGHGRGASIMKISNLKSFGSGGPSSYADGHQGVGGGSGEGRKASGTGVGGLGGGNVDVEKMQAKGKEVLKSAGMGAKGLFAKGRSRFGRGGGEGKASSPVPSPSHPAPKSALPPPTPSTPTTPTKTPPLSAGMAPRPQQQQRQSIFTRLRSASRSKSRPSSLILPNATVDEDVRSRSRSRPGSQLLDRADWKPPQLSPGAGEEVPVITDEMRERSRSRSRSRSRRRSGSGSLGAAGRKPVEGVDEELPALPGVYAIAGSGMSGGGERRREAWENGPTPQRREAWEDSSATPIQRREAWENATELPSAGAPETPSRLGVLPSPATDGFSVAGSPSKRPRRSTIEAPMEKKVDEERWAEAVAARAVEDEPGSVNTSRNGTNARDLDLREESALEQLRDSALGKPLPQVEREAPAAESSPFDEATARATVHPDDITTAEEVRSTSAAVEPVVSRTPTRTPQGSEDDLVSPLPEIPKSRPRTPMQQLVHEDAQSSPYDTHSSSPYATVPSTPVRPQHERSVSALSELPSQQRHRSLSTAASPVSSPGAERTLEESMYGALPAGQRMSWLPEPSMTPFAVETPMVKTPAPEDAVAGADKSLGSATARKDPDNHSVVSAAEELHTDANHGKNEDAASRRSSVSSLGSPGSHDTVMTPAKRQSLLALADKRKSMTDPGLVQRLADSPAPVEVLATQAPPTDGPASQPDGFAPQAMDRSRPPSVQRAFSGSQVPAQGFMQRSYSHDVGNGNRPMSYMPMGRDSSGLPVQEVLNAPSPETTSAVDISSHSGPPPGALPFQQHPAHRGSTSRPPSIGRPPSIYDRLRSPQPGDESAAYDVPGDRSSRRMSGYYGSGAYPPAGGATLPTPSRIDDQYGLDQDVTQMMEDMRQADRPGRPDKQAKRRSGIWGTLKRSPSTSLSSFSRPPSAGGNQAMNPTSQAPTARPKTLQKIQRASSSAVVPEPEKKKRFSRLGSIFRRGSTKEHVSNKPNKLTKMAPPPSQPPQQGYSRPHNGAAAPSNYDGYEAMRRQQAQQSQPGSGYMQQPQPQQYGEPVMSSPYQQRPPSMHSRSSSLAGGHAAQPMEYYGYQGAQSPTGYNRAVDHHMAQGPGAHSQLPMRRLHSEGRLPSYGLPAETMGPAAGHQRQTSGSYGASAPNARANSLVRSPAHSRHSSLTSTSPQMARPSLQQRIPSYGSDNFPQAPGRQDYQTQYWNPPVPAQRGVLGMQPLQTQIGPNHGQRSTSMGSIDHQMARSPAREYADQQTPYGISMPVGQDSAGRDPRMSPPTNQLDQPRRYVGPPRAAVGAVSPPPEERMRGQYGPPMMPYTPISPQQQQQDYYQPNPQPRHNGQIYYDQNVYSTDNGVYPSPPHTPASPQMHNEPQGNGAPQYYTGPRHHQRVPSGEQYPPPQHYRTPSGERFAQILVPKSRFSGQGPTPSAADVAMQYAAPEGRPLTHQRTASGYSGRRDDAAVSEAEIMNMRGASYPGQEWAPQMYR